MWLQKELINKNYMELATARANNRKVSATFVPGNLNELLMCFDFARSLPETNALQNGMRKKSGKMIMDAERDGQSEDVCTYVKADLGMMMGGETWPHRRAAARPRHPAALLHRLLHLHEVVRADPPQVRCETVMLHVPYQGEGQIAPNMRDYVVKQLKEEVIPTLEKSPASSSTSTGCASTCAESVKAEDDLVWVLQSAKNRPSPIDGYFGARVLHRPDLHRLPGHARSHAVLPPLRAEIDERVRLGLGPVTPKAPWANQKYRLVVEGPPNWTSFRELLEDVLRRRRGGGVVSTYTKVGGLYDFGFRHDPDRPLESLADYCLGCYTNLNLPSRVDMLCRSYIDEYQADGLLINSIKSCNSFSAGQLMILRRWKSAPASPGPSSRPTWWTRATFRRPTSRTGWRATSR
jgi:benzoyl-CoA reductase subunit B